MNLTVMERVVLGNLLPAEGDFITLKVLRKLREDLSFSDVDFKKWDIQTIPSTDGGGSRLAWKMVNDKGKPIDQEAEISIGEKATDVIVESLEKLNESKKLTNDYFTLYEKFVENGAK